MNYPVLINILRSVFSVDVGLEACEAQAALERVLNDSVQKVRLEKELKCLFQDGSVSWVHLLDNDDYVVYPADDEFEAKEYFMTIIGRQIFVDD